MDIKPSDQISAFLAKAPADKRQALESLRKTIRDAAPDATEGIGYDIPMFKYQGHLLVSIGFAKNHCFFYVQSPAVMKSHAADFKGYDTAKGTIHFTPDKPLPAALVRKLVKARIKETEQRFGK
ncbi:MAG: DUF1801 domain-containing protein [Anaerolineales bacterium]